MRFLSMFAKFSLKIYPLNSLKFAQILIFVLKMHQIILSLNTPKKSSHKAQELFSVVLDKT